MYYELLKVSAEKLDLELSKEQYSQFERYKELLQEWNEKMNLTTITDDEEIYRKHFIDSIKAFEFKPLLEAKKVIDVGTGAGFPGFPIKIMKPEIQLTLLDSLNKRLNFLKEVSSTLNLTDVEFVHSRAEDGGNNKLYREQYDVAVSRAVANLTLLTELCLPYVKVGGYFLALKGPAVEVELKEAEFAINKLGGQVLEVREVEIEGTELKHNLLIIEKVSRTPKGFPRSSSAIKKGLITK